MIEAVLIANENGLPIYSKILTNKKVEVNLILSFFTALKVFSSSFQDMGENALQSVNMGAYLFNFDNVHFDHLGEVDVIIISKGIATTSSQSLIEEITEIFALFLDNFTINHPDALDIIKLGFYPNFKDFDDPLEDIINSFEVEEKTEIGFAISLSSEVFNSIDQIFAENPAIADIYDSSSQLLLDQLFSEYANNNLSKDIQKKFKKSKKSSFNPWN